VLNRLKINVNYLLVLNILYVTYFVTSLTMPDPQSSDMRHNMVNDATTLPLASARLSKLWIPFLKHLLGVNICLISIFSLCFTYFESHDFITYTDFARIAASNTATDNVTH